MSFNIGPKGEAGIKEYSYKRWLFAGDVIHVVEETVVGKTSFTKAGNLVGEFREPLIVERSRVVQELADAVAGRGDNVGAVLTVRTTIGSNISQMVEIDTGLWVSINSFNGTINGVYPERRVLRATKI
jgi:hypothetical protein